MTSVEAELFTWRPVKGCEWVEVSENTFRPAQLEAEFRLPDLHVTVLAEGTESGVRITHLNQVARYPGGDGLDRVHESAWSDGVYMAEELRNEDLARFDMAAAMAALREAAVRSYIYDVVGRPTLVRYGSGSPYLSVVDVRSSLSGPEAAPKPGPKPKATPEEVAVVWRKATRKGLPAARAVADAFSVSVASAHRYVASARKAGLIEEKK
jgi:hypothetical protein